MRLDFFFESKAIIKVSVITRLALHFSNASAAFSGAAIPCVAGNQVGKCFRSFARKVESISNMPASPCPVGIEKLIVVH